MPYPTTASGSSEVVGLFGRRVSPARSIGDETAQLANAAYAMARRFHRGAKLIVFASGTATTDAAHIAVEFVHPVIVGKRALPAVSVSSDVATCTGLAQSESAEDVFIHQLRALARPEDIALGVSANGSCGSVLSGLEFAHSTGIRTVALTGGNGGAISASAAVDHSIVARSDDPRVVKEVHVTTYHILWELVHVFLEQPGVLESESDP